MTKRPPNRSWVGFLAAPLFIISLALHGLLLVFPMPSGSENAEEPEVEEPEPEEDEPVDLLSLSSLEAEQPVPAEPPPEAPPAATAAAPAAPSQPVVPDPQQTPETQTPETPLSEPPPVEEEPAAPSFSPRQAASAALTAISRTADDRPNSYDSTDDFKQNPDIYLDGLSPDQIGCFFQNLTPPEPQLVDGAIAFMNIGRDMDKVENNDLDRTFPPPLQWEQNSPKYCQALGPRTRFYQVLQNGEPGLWVSLVGLGAGEAGTLVILWERDPRL